MRSPARAAGRSFPPTRTKRTRRAGRYLRSSSGRARPEDSAWFRQPSSDRLEQAEACLRHRGEDRFPVGALVVPFELDLAHQVRVRELEAVVTAQGAGKPTDAALAADAADLDGFGSSRHLARSYRPLGEVRGNRFEAPLAPDLELPVALAALGIER